jgi:hypothetical protein
MEFIKDQRVKCTYGEYIEKTGTVTRNNTLKLKKTLASIVQFDGETKNILMYNTQLTLI